MIEQPITPGQRPDEAAAAPPRRAEVTNDRVRPRRRHTAQGARIAAVGIGATTMAGLVGILGYTQPPSATPPAPGQVAVVISYGDLGGASLPTGAGSTGASSANTTLTARPTVRSASPTAQSPAASTNGSN